MLMCQWNIRQEQATPLRRIRIRDWVGRSAACCVWIATLCGVPGKTARADEGWAVTGWCRDTDVFVRAQSLWAAAELCPALADVRGLFEELGFTFKPAFTASLDVPLSADPGAPPAHGSYDPKTRELVLYRRSGSHPWGLPWSLPIAGTFMRHELAHMAIVHILGPSSSRLRREWHEFIAYVVQFELMSTELRGQILWQYPGLAPVTTLDQINAFTFEFAEPDEFSVLAYISYRAHGGKDLIRRLLTLEAQPPPIDIMPPVPQ